MANEIFWPDGYVPGFSDNFASNEVISAGLSAEEIWPFLVTPENWLQYYRNSANIRFHGGKGPELEQGARFCFETFGFLVEAEVTEYVAPVPGQPGRVAWHGWVGDVGSEERLDVHHAWLIEDMPGQRVRILTQETQNGMPARKLAITRPNPMINGHQEWLDGLISTAQRARA